MNYPDIEIKMKANSSSCNCRLKPDQNFLYLLGWFDYLLSVEIVFRYSSVLACVCKCFVLTFYFLSHNEMKFISFGPMFSHVKNPIFSVNRNINL